MRVAVYAGSFDPFTLGHLSVLEGALASFDHVFLAIGKNNAKKSGWFSIEERKELIQLTLENGYYQGTLRRITVTAFSGLLVQFCTNVWNQATGDQLPESVSIIRGLRALSDLEIEMSIADANARLDSRFQTLFIPTKAPLAYISSSTAKEIAMNTNDTKTLEGYLHPAVAQRVLDRAKYLKVGETIP